MKRLRGIIEDVCAERDAAVAAQRAPKAAEARYTVEREGELVGIHYNIHAARSDRDMFGGQLYALVPLTAEGSKP